MKTKPAKPSPDFPLTPHGNGKWCKKIGQRLYYFGSWENPDEALREYLEIRESLQVGIDPRKHKGSVDLADLVNLHLMTKKEQADLGELKYRTWDDLANLYSEMLTILGRTTPVSSLGPDQFQKLRNTLAQKWGPVRMKVVLVRIRSLFRWAEESGQIPHMPRFGPDFKAPKKKIIRAARNAAPKKFMEAKVVRQLIEGAKQPMKSMILLAINGGFGNTDVASLPLSAAKAGSAWLDYPRPKTGVERHVPLWPETASSIQEWLLKRPESKSSLLFLTPECRPWVWEKAKAGSRNDEVAKQFSKLLKRLGLNGPGRSFYALRHTFRTVADETLDRPAIEVIMGHAEDQGDMGSVYREGVSDERLLRVVNYVRDWLYGNPEAE